MRIAPIAAAVVTCAIVIWMVSFGPKFGPVRSEDLGFAPLAASDLGHSSSGPSHPSLNAVG